MKKTIYVLALCSIFFGALPSNARESEQVIKQKLESIAKKLVKSAADHVMPNAAKKDVHQENNQYVAYYIEIDQSSLRTEMRSSEKAGNYVGLIKYKEVHYKCSAPTKQEALKAPCYRARSRNLTEIISYDGKWRY